MYDHIYVIGDIHGMYYRLQGLLDRLEYGEKDLFIFLGDYVDRGEYCLKCLDVVYDMVKSGKAVALKGNHERMMEWYFAKHDIAGAKTGIDEETEGWLYCGGSNTYDDLKRYYEKNGSIEKYLDFVKNLPPVMSLGNKVFFSHSGFNVKKKIKGEELSEDDYLWNRDGFLGDYDEESIWYVGHTPVQYILQEGEEVKPMSLENNIVMMDTGSYMSNGCISAMDILTNKLYRSNVAHYKMKKSNF